MNATFTSYSRDSSVNPKNKFDPNNHHSPVYDINGFETGFNDLNFTLSSMESIDKTYKYKWRSNNSNRPNMTFKDLIK